ncbi:MAG: LCP family protein [Ruminococcus sp.]|nr:LCP family protein [Ruminococcus sp.]
MKQKMVGVIMDEENYTSEQEDNASEQENGELEPEEKKKWNRKRKIITIVVIVAAILILAGATVIGIIYHYIGKINIEETKDVDVDSAISEMADELDIDTDSKDKDEIVDEIEKSLNDDESDSSETDSDTVTSVNDTNLQNYNTMSADVMSDPDVTNILLIGTDTRDTSERGRSDSMILVSLNTRTNKLLMFSFLRDIYIYIPGVGSTRLNHAYAYGGAELTMQTIEGNFGIEIDKYVKVDFFSFIEAIDAVGGVDITVTDAEAELINEYLGEINNLVGDKSGSDKLSCGGDLHLNGKQALCYARIRYIGTDFERTRRQRDVLNQVLEKVENMSLGELDTFLDTVLPLITTNISSSEIFSYMMNASEYTSYTRVADSIPISGTYSFMTVRGMSVIGIDFTQNANILRNNIYGD